jgi:AraC family transcriptional regulator, melibiose operon regulatory protein
MVAKVAAREVPLAPAEPAPGDRPGDRPAHERRFYAQDRAIGRFGMRIFAPSLMPQPHWHGHVEANFLTGASMRYRMEDQEIEVPEGRLVLFWAGLPHQLTAVTPLPGAAPARLANIYLPLDSFLLMPHIAALQVALLGGGLVCLPARLCNADQVAGWYRDYRSGDVERTEVMKMELNALLRRALLEPLYFLRAPIAEPGGDRQQSSAQIRHVVAMVRFIMENISEPLTNARVAAVTGLHETYALALFTRIMRVPLKKFVIRMRLLRARALLLESELAIAQVAERSGFASISQFYDHFGRAYGLPPQQMRAQYTQMALR